MPTLTIAYLAVKFTEHGNFVRPGIVALAGSAKKASHLKRKETGKSLGFSMVKG